MAISRISKQACTGKSWYLCMWDFFFMFLIFLNSIQIQKMCQLYDCFGITFVWHFFECVHTLMINWYEKLLSEYFIAMNKKTWMEHPVQHAEHFDPVGPHRAHASFLGCCPWLQMLGSHQMGFEPVCPPQSAATCLSFILFCLCTSLFATLSMLGLFQSSAVPHAEYPSKSERERESFAKPELFGWTALRLRG